MWVRQEIPQLKDGGEELSADAAVEDEFDLADIMGEGLEEPRIKTEL